jgi:hypothetical protein
VYRVRGGTLFILSPGLAIPTSFFVLPRPYSKKTLGYLITPCLYGHLRILAFFTTDAHTFVSCGIHCEVVKHIGAVKSTIFWDITPCSPLKVNRHFGGTYRLLLQGRRISRARNQRESRWQAETSVDTQRTTRRYIPEDSTLYNLRCENLKSYIGLLFSEVRLLATRPISRLNDLLSGPYPSTFLAWVTLP